MGYYQARGSSAGIGTVVHGMLAEYYKPGFKSEDLTDVDPELLDYAVPMVATYISEVESGGLDVGRRTIDVELRLSTSSLGTGELNGQVDWLFEDDMTGDIVLGDHKNTASFFDTAPHDFQLLTYAVILADNGIEVTAAEHNILKINKRTGRSKPPYTQRNRIEINEDMVGRHRAMLRHMLFDREQALALAEISGEGVRHPVIYPIGKNDCSWSCDYYDVCGLISAGEEYEIVLQTEYLQAEL
jgi:hypothetical protein